ncbi:sialidase [Actinoplanes sp. ATCC 53533]|uniref:discoidin domain-containing protein n=1 Tax=Actinoplanes sp. ATCC 53533 TaxID=1288362 RepID=UPI000F76872C|nr:discoidin domain-containing protein [Actinoplanes sp. ATCC 53533]RSM72520.1 sialidase [Actinoplanes sp. ATCC 53533]
MEAAPVPRLGALTGLVLTLVAALTLVTPQRALAADPLVSQGKTATASSTENGTFPASAAVDGDTGTRWSSAFSDPQWIRVDLGASYAISQVVLNWEAAYASAYQIQTSADGTAWTTVSSTTGGTGGIQTLAVAGTGRYVRMNGTARATPYGYSLFEFQVYGVPAGGPTIPGGGSLGPNVLVFDPSMSTASIQSQLTSVFQQSETQQFGSQRYELLFKPGTYHDLTANIGFYTSIAGLGRNPTDVHLNSSNLTVDAGWFGGNATQNFWRSSENFSVTPPAGTAYERWAVAQAAPMRRMNINTHLSLTPTGFGWASGGYIADTKVNGQLQPFSQQQWYTRNSSIAMNLNAVWNNVFTGVVGAPATTFPNPPITTMATTPISREKPYLYLDGANYAVWVPSLQTNSSNVTWPNTPGGSIPLTQFYVAHPGDSAATINAALAQGLNLLFTPGIYHVDQTINVTRANTVVMGLGYATIIPDGGVTPMTVADVDGVKISSLLFDAGTTNSPNLLQIGPAGSSANHAANPTSVQDVFFRIGGAGPGSATNSLLVNSNNTLLDHIWAWRADHGAGVGWTTNPAASGLIVNGNDVLALGLFVEHYQNYQVQWNGNGGRTIFFQNELPYDPPTQAAWRSGTNGYAAYKVADSVTTHEAWGLGSYCYFNVNPSIVAARGFEVPVKPGVRMHNLLTVSLGGVGSITNVINTTGGVAQGTETVPSYVVNFP